jgi:hypothetical protein
VFCYVGKINNAAEISIDSTGVLIPDKIERGTIKLDPETLIS